MAIIADEVLPCRGPRQTLGYTPRPAPAGEAQYHRRASVQDGNRQSVALGVGEYVSEEPLMGAVLPGPPSNAFPAVR